MNLHYYATSDPDTIRGMEEFRARIKEARQLIAEKFRERLGVKDVVLMQKSLGLGDGTEPVDRA